MNTVECISLLLQHGANINRKVDVNGEEFMMSAVIFAAYNGHIGVLKLLAEHGAEMDIAGRDNWTPLHHVSWFSGNIECAKFLIDKGANVNAKTKEAQTPLMIAALQGFDDIVRLLLEKGADASRL